MRYLWLLTLFSLSVAALPIIPDTTPTAAVNETIQLWDSPFPNPYPEDGNTDKEIPSISEIDSTPTTRPEDIFIVSGDSPFPNPYPEDGNTDEEIPPISEIDSTRPSDIIIVPGDSPFPDPYPDQQPFPVTSSKDSEVPVIIAGDSPFPVPYPEASSVTVAQTFEVETLKESTASSVSLVTSTETVLDTSSGVFSSPISTSSNPTQIPTTQPAVLSSPSPLVISKQRVYAPTQTFSRKCRPHYY